jgi:sugar (pentulose or hexulose) kinase
VSLLLGLDVGTTAVKAALFDTSGRELAHGRAPTPWRAVPTGAELDPDELLHAAVAAAREAVAAAGGGTVAAVGVAGMAETGVLLDGHGRPAVPSIAWHDSRGGEQAERLGRDLPDFSERTGLPVRTMCTLVKYRWMRDHWPDSARGVRWLNVSEWIVRGMGGDPAAELSLASRTGFYDLHERRPWADALAWADAPPGLMPDAVPAGTPMGTTGDGAVLAVGGHDHLAAAVGAGATGDGDVLNSCGTAEAFVRTTAPLPPDRVAQAVDHGFTVGWHAVAGRQALQGGLTTGMALERVLEDAGIAPDDRDEVEAAALAIERSEAGHGRAVGDDRAAGDDRPAGDVRAAAAAYHAALDAAGADGARLLDRMAEVAGPARRVVVTGGWASGPAAQAVKRRHLGPFEYRSGISQGARGAALAAGRAAGVVEPALQEVT